MCEGVGHVHCEGEEVHCSMWLYSVCQLAKFWLDLTVFIKYVRLIVRP